MHLKGRHPAWVSGVRGPAGPQSSPPPPAAATKNHTTEPTVSSKAKASLRAPVPAQPPTRSILSPSGSRCLGVYSPLTRQLREQCLHFKDEGGRLRETNTLFMLRVHHPQKSACPHNRPSERSALKELHTSQAGRRG